MLRLIIIALLCFASSCAPNAARSSVSADSGVLTLNGEVDAEMLRAVREIDLSTIDTLLLNSPGGDQSDAISIAEILLEDRPRRVIVRGQCFSSCAQYLFIVGEEKIIEKGSRVACHNNYIGSRYIKHVDDGARAQLNKEASRALELYERLGISEDFGLICQTEVVVGQCIILRENGFTFKQLPLLYLLSDEDFIRFGIANVSGAPEGVAFDGEMIRSAAVFREDGRTYMRDSNLPRDAAIFRIERVKPC